MHTPSCSGALLYPASSGNELARVHLGNQMSRSLEEHQRATTEHISLASELIHSLVNRILATVIKISLTRHWYQIRSNWSKLVCTCLTRATTGKNILSQRQLTLSRHIWPCCYQLITLHLCHSLPLFLAAEEGAHFLLGDTRSLC